MQRTLLVFAFMAVLLAPTASPGSPDSPEVADPAGDVTLYPGAPLPSGAADAVDVVATWFHDETDTSIQLTMKVTEISVHAGTGTVPLSMLRLGTRFSTPYIPTGSDDYWDNIWVASADYRPGAWEAWLEPPSVDGHRQDSTDVESVVDEAAGTVTLTLPRDLLGSPKAGQRLTTIHSLHAMSWPTYGVFFADQGPDDYSAGGSYTFQGPVDPKAAPPSGAAAGASQGEPGPAGGGPGGSTSGGGSAGGSGSATNEPQAGAGAEAAGQGRDPQAGAPAGMAPAKAPSPAAALLGFTLLAVATVRRR